MLCIFYQMFDKKANLFYTLSLKRRIFLNPWAFHVSSYLIMLRRREWENSVNSRLCFCQDLCSPLLALYKEEKPSNSWSVTSGESFLGRVLSMLVLCFRATATPASPLVSHPLSSIPPAELNNIRLRSSVVGGSLEFCETLQKANFQSSFLCH